MIYLNPFYEQVYDIARKIPYGKVVSYGQIAWFLGYPRSARQVGRAMGCCNEDLPCHRVVMSDGAVAGGIFAQMRREMLMDEGVAFFGDGRLDMERYQWDMQDLVEDE